MSNNKAAIAAVRQALSHARMATYEAASKVTKDDDPSALILYAWNAEVSGALLAPLHVCEVVIRNAVNDALERIYGNKWPWSPTFERSLPDPKIGYSPRKDLQSARRSAHTTGKVIPELKFVFWQKMFTSRYDIRLWDIHLHNVLPQLDITKGVTANRQMIYDQLEQLRKLRNRIAHHEPIFNRNLTDDFQIMLGVIEARCAVTKAWLDTNQTATSVITRKP